MERFKFDGETNGLTDPSAYHEAVTHRITETLYWDDKRLKKITRLRLVSDPGFPAWDLSYCHGVDVDGNPVQVELPFSQLPKGKGQIQRAIIAHAKRDGVFAKGLGVFNSISTLC